MTAIFATSRKSETLTSFALILIAASPLVFGCQPPWASGVLLSAVMLLTGIFVLRQLWRKEQWLNVNPSMAWTGFVLLAWVVAGAARDVLLGPAGNSPRVPAISLHQLHYVGGFFAAAILGAAYSAGGTRLPNLLRALTAVGLVLAVFALLQFWGWDVKKIAGWQEVTTRPSGLYTNANRFAVLMTLCWMCAIALLLTSWSTRRSSANIKTTALIGVVVILSISIALTLSRLTIIGAGLAVVIVSIAWLINHGSRNDGDISFLPVASRIERYTLLLLPLIVVAGWGIWCLLVGSTALRNRFAELQPHLDLEGRIHAAQMALPLVLQQPLWGHGLGSFETSFATVQPENLPGRWRELHCDWLQVALEAGIPAALFATALSLAWFAAVWRGLKSCTGEFFVLALPAAGILVFLFCSTADFPLREPASAMIAFFTAGALISTPAAAVEPRGSWPASFIVALALLTGSIFSARDALAYLCSPWVGRIYPPTLTSEQLEAWQRAARFNPTDPELQFRVATAAFSAGKLDIARDAAQAAQRLQPLDHRFPWIEAAIAESSGELSRAAELREQAASRYPNNWVLREQNGRFYLSRDVMRSVPGQPERESGLQNCLENFRVVLRCSPSREPALIDAMELAGCLNLEIAGLWPGGEDSQRIRRARFYCSKNQWDNAERDLPKTEPAKDTERRWYYGITGAIAMRRGDIQQGQTALKQALTAPDPSLDGWLADEFRNLTPVSCENLAGELASSLFKYPLLAGTLASRLMEDGRWASADRMLEKVSGASPDLGAQWAELALQMGNIPAASDRARMAWEQGLFSPRWGNWYSQFQERIRQRKER